MTLIAGARLGPYEILTTIGAGEVYKLLQAGQPPSYDVAPGLVRWEFRYPRPSFGGTLSTASGLVFAGEEDGNVMAFDAASGKNLWRLQTGAGLRAGPMSFMHNGKQYVVVASGGAVIAFALPEGR